MSSYYAVANGKQKGIFTNWNDCNQSVKGFKHAIYKKFNSKEEAELFIENHSMMTPTHLLEKTEETPDFYVYTDGACSNNGRKNASAGIGIYFSPEDTRNLSKKIEGKQTNNIAELTAIIETYFIIESDIRNGQKIAIVSDSEYAIKCVSSYGQKCENKDWNVDIPNKEIVKQAYQLYKNTPNVQFIHIRAHTNQTDIHSIGNENADRLANIAIGLETCPYQK
jgi:ribonuclease HI